MGGFTASPAQRKAVKETTCIYCGREGVDPAHLIPRGLGGCDDPLCVLGLCRRCHSQYDVGWLNILDIVREKYPDHWEHAVSHVGEGRAEWRLSNERPQ